MSSFIKINKLIQKIDLPSQFITSYLKHIVKCYENETKKDIKKKKLNKPKSYNNSKQSKNLSKRRQSHISQLRQGNHNNGYLQNSFDEYGEEYLENIYGDWKNLPPIEKRIKQHNYVYMDLKKPYMEKAKFETIS